jgi:hypothetical protein
MKEHFAQLSDQELLDRIHSLVRIERERTVQVIEHLAEGIKRGLFVKIGYSSLPQYCRKVLHYSEDEAYLRSTVAICAIRFPAVLEKLADGSVTMTTINQLARHLTEENHLELLERARHKTKFQVKEIVAALDPNGPVPPSIWELPQVTPLAPKLYKFEFTGGLTTYEKLCQLKDLLRHRIPTGDIGVVIDTALTIALEQVMKQKIGTDLSDASRSFPGDSTARAEPMQAEAKAETPVENSREVNKSRYIPKTVKRDVWQRDEGRCAYRSPAGDRCPSTDWLEFHHVEPYAWGGAATVENIELRCRTHNGFEAELLFGPHQRE